VSVSACVCVSRRWMEVAYESVHVKEET